VRFLNYHFLSNHSLSLNFRVKYLFVYCSLTTLFIVISILFCIIDGTSIVAKDRDSINVYLPSLAIIKISFTIQNKVDVAKNKVVKPMKG
jgi:hypothetical protein